MLSKKKGGGKDLPKKCSNKRKGKKRLSRSIAPHGDLKTMKLLEKRKEKRQAPATTASAFVLKRVLRFPFRF